MPTFTPPPIPKQMAQTKPARPPQDKNAVFPPPLPLSPHRITGCYTADEVRGLPGELVSIEGTQPPGRYWCVWLEDVE